MCTTCWGRPDVFAVVEVAEQKELNTLVMDKIQSIEGVGRTEAHISSQRLDLQISLMSASVLCLIQVFGLGFLFVPINLVAYVGTPAEKSGSAAGLVNFMRNIGSSVGTSMVTTLITRRAQVHQAYLAAHVTPGQPGVGSAAATLAARVAAGGVQTELAVKKAYALLRQRLIVQAMTLAYIDTFLVLATAAAIMFVLSFMLRKNHPGGGRMVME
jgi:MFS transporter, DHA2 family, multidrug resistance protein